MNNTGRKRVRRARKNESIKRILLTVCMMAMVAAISIGGTLAWLTDETTEVKNEFITTDLNVDLEESENLDFTIIPGKDIPKDPKVTADTDVDSFVFVKVTKANWPTAKENDNLKVNYEIADDWTYLTAGEGYEVYYCELGANEVLTQVSILKGDTVYVSPSLTKAEMEAITATGTPTLTFQAYQIQQLKQNGTNFTAEEAWAQVSGT